VGRVIMNGPPPGNWCLACLMTAKQRHWEANQDDFDKAAAAGGDKLTVIPWPEALTREIREGIYRAVCGEFPSVGVVEPLCWNHVAGIDPSPVASRLVEAPAGLAAPAPRGRRRA
jgi:hypothetical protein